MYYNIPYEHTLHGTNIHWITCLIILCEGLIFFYQLIHWLSRPSDRPRFWYLLFVFLMLTYNTIGGLFVDATLPIKLEIQLYIEVLVAILVSMYFPFYIYYGLRIKELEFFAWKGSLYFLFVPFILCFVLFNEVVVEDVRVSLIVFVATINIYAAYYLYRLYKSFFIRIKDKSLEWPLKERFIGLTVTITFWVGCLSCFAFVNVNQYTEHALTNLGFLIMSYIFIRQSIVASKKEYAELQNINEMLMQKVKERTNELEYSIEQKTNTFISLTHEIRTPLTLVKNYLDEHVAKHGMSDELRIVSENVDILNNDVNTFFKEEKFLSGLSTYNHSQVIDFSRFVADKINSFKLYATKKGITLSGKITNNISIKAAPEALHSIVNNLIENAIKFTSPDGLISVSLTTQGDKIFFSVTDTGCGIPQGLYKKVFDPYFQIDNNNSNSGAGIGLSIVENCVKSLSGKVLLRSQENEGSEFIIELHRYSADKNVIDNKETSGTDPLVISEIEDSVVDQSKPYILIIEDNRDMLLYLRDKLKVNYNVLLSENGMQALQKLKNIRTPDLIISDVMMQEMDGLEFLKTISQDTHYSHIPFLFLSANTTSHTKHVGYSLGAIDYIQKPFSIHDLLMKVEAIISNNLKQIDFLKNLAFSNLNKVNNNKTLAPAPPLTQQEIFETNCTQYAITVREKEIIALIKQSLTYKEIGAKLYISEKTVHKHCENIFNKLKVNNKLDLLNKLQA